MIRSKALQKGKCFRGKLMLEEEAYDSDVMSFLYFHEFSDLLDDFE